MNYETVIFHAKFSQTDLIFEIYLLFLTLIRFNCVINLVLSYVDLQTDQEELQTENPPSQRPERRSNPHPEGRNRFGHLRRRRDPHRGHVSPSGRLRGKESSLCVHALQTRPGVGHGGQTGVADGHGQETCGV